MNNVINNFDPFGIYIDTRKTNNSIYNVIYCLYNKPIHFQKIK